MKTFIKTSIVTSIVAAGLIFAGSASTAQAAGPFGFIRIGGGSVIHAGHHGVHPFHTGIQSNFGGFHGGHGPHLDWHDTSHLHWRPAGAVRHGNHFDYVPGGWEVHRTGHWDVHHW